MSKLRQVLATEGGSVDADALLFRRRRAPDSAPASLTTGTVLPPPRGTPHWRVCRRSGRLLSVTRHPIYTVASCHRARTEHRYLTRLLAATARRDTPTLDMLNTIGVRALTTNSTAVIDCFSPASSAEPTFSAQC